MCVMISEIEIMITIGLVYTANTLTAITVMVSFMDNLQEYIE